MGNSVQGREVKNEGSQLRAEGKTCEVGFIYNRRREQNGNDAEETFEWILRIEAQSRGGSISEEWGDKVAFTDRDPCRIRQSL